MKRALFTKENRQKTREGIKTETRRIGENPWRAEVGETRAIAEPTQVLSLAVCKPRTNQDLNHQCRVQVLYPDNKETIVKDISIDSFKKLANRKDYRKTAIARFMLDDFARHCIKITALKVEPLQEITPEGCFREGIRVYEGDRLVLPGETRLDDAIYLDGFIRLWNSINTGDRCWDKNPIVTAYSYEYLGTGRDYQAEVAGKGASA